tara:strand:+ start:92781 stop:93560 length:780 start_codon:yes stop_codon:yes gene_type:complete
MQEEDSPRAGPTGWQDMRLDGWLNGVDGELAPGLRVTSSDTVIDVGCGAGVYSKFCAKQGAEVFFIDRDEAALEHTTAKVAASPARAFRAILSDCNPIPLADNSGDLVICTEVLEHVPDPVVFLRELIRVARPGGALLITVPDARSEQLMAATAPPQYFEEPNHIRIFTADALRRLVLGAGLSIESHCFAGCFESIYWPLSWLTCEPGAGLPADNSHPIPDHWTRLWHAVQCHPRGHLIRNALNQLLPRSQAIIARKPG